jgi:hypothetical protein
METILNGIIAMGIEDGPVIFQMTAPVMVQVLRKGNACIGKACNEK